MTEWALRYPLREWQADALDQWTKQHRGVAAVVTGGGKTMFAYACMMAAAKAWPDLTFVIVVPTVALMDQWSVGLVDDLGVDPTDIATTGGGRRARSIRRVNLMVLNSARTLAPQLASTRRTMLVVDECHRAASEQNSLALEGEHVATLGLSATPKRDFDDLFATVVEPALGRVFYEYGYNEAMRDQVISPFELINVKISLTEEEQATYDAFTRRIIVAMRRRKGGADVDEQLERLLRERSRVSTLARARLPMTIRLIEEHRLEKAIVFHEQIQAADIIARTLLDRRHRSAVYHSGLGPSIRQDNLRMFKSGGVDVLVTCRALDEGVNVPNASVAVIAASTASTRQRIQRLGRVLRPAPGKTLSTVYTLYATSPEEDRLRVEAETLEGVESIRWLRESP